MKLNDLKAGMYGKLRDGRSISILDDGCGVIELFGYNFITLSFFYNEDLTHKYDKDRDITELWYGDKLVFERKRGETPVDWKPEYGEWYYSVSDFGNVCHTKWENDHIDNKVFNLSRMFKSKVEAEKHLRWLKAKRIIELEIARLNEGWTPNWDNSDERKWVVAFDFDCKELDTLSYYIFKTLPNSMYLKSYDLAEQLIETHKEELTIYFQG